MCDNYIGTYNLDLSLQIVFRLFYQVKWLSQTYLMLIVLQSSLLTPGRRTYHTTECQQQRDLTVSKELLAYQRLVVEPQCQGTQKTGPTWLYLMSKVP